MIRVNEKWSGNAWPFFIRRVVRMGVLNYYELLGIPYDADDNEIREAYNNKIINAKNEIMTEKYKTAYFTLADINRRQSYDLYIGMHKYRKVNIFLRFGKALLRVVLTLVDAFFSFYWCFLFVIICFVFVSVYNQNTYEQAHNIIGFLNTYGRNVIEYVGQNRTVGIILIAIAAIDVIFHFYIRRLNRYLKHYRWEVTEKR